MKKIIILSILLLLAGAAFAQKATLATGVKNESGKLVVQLKFMFPDKVMSGYSVNVFRKQSSAGNWEKISSVPVVKTAVVKDNKQGDESYQNYQAFMGRKPSADPEEESNALAFAGLMVITNNVFAKYAGCYFEDNTAEPGKIYQYRITDAANGDKELAVSGDCTVTLNYLPQVKGLGTKQTGQTIFLNWEKNSRFYAYNVYRRNAPGGERKALSEYPILLGKISSTAAKDVSGDYKYTDTGITAGSTVYYEITGVDVLGNESPVSAQVTATIKDMVPPGVISRLKAVTDKTDVKLTWQGAHDNDLKGYNIYRNSYYDTAYKKINAAILAPGILTYTDKGLKEGDVYGYKIESVDEAGNTTLSRPAKAFFPDKTPPAKPIGLKAVCRPGVIQLTWTPNKESDVAGYYIFRATTRNKQYFSMLYKEPITTSSFNDTLPAVAKNEFIYYIQAVDKNYNTGAPSDTVIAVLPDTIAPHAPFIRSVNYIAGYIKIDWAQPDNDGVRFDVYRSTDSINSRAYTKINATSVQEKTYTDKITVKNQQYYYYIVAYDKAGNASSRSQKRAMYVDADSLSRQGVENVNVAFNSKDTSVTITWKTPKGDIRGNMVYRKEAEGNRYSSVSALIRQDEFIDRTVEAGKKYDYKVRSLFSSGDGFVDSKEVKIATE